MVPDPAAPEHNYEYGREHGGYSHVGIPPGCPACAAERQNAPTAPEDPASTALAAIRAIEGAATPGEWKHRTAEGRGDWTSGSKTYAVHRVEADAEPRGIGIFSTTADAEFVVTARTAMPRLLAAVEAVLELHKPADRGTGAQCKGCATHVTFTRWPCPTYLAITSALTGPEETVDHRTEAERRAADEALEALRAKLAGKG